ncbi:MAG: molybdopterin molybdotransferase MoeA [Syntrophobacteraceae bacterium]|jgi:molybdopterin molybdotransferase|nr:molybdopterin molybdotransferase MoeA [Syntrophobacteraceae bacterium]
MTQFLKVKTASEVLTLIAGLRPLPTEPVPLHEAGRRVLASPLRAPEAVPHFHRAVMDGYAVQARDTFGASETLPALLETDGEIQMGEIPGRPLKTGRAMGIPTGGMLPEGADAVVMVEYTQPLDEQTIEVTRPVAPGDNVLKRGEDIESGQDLFSAGWRLRPQDIGVLAALGVREVTVYRKPRVAVFSTGDEVVPLDRQGLPPGKVRDINTYTLSSHLRESGFHTTTLPVVPDQLEALVETCRSALESHDVVMLSGGSSVGARDFTLRILGAIPGAELLVHGVAIRPGKPAILARMGHKLFWGLPGQPMSALMICHAFGLPSLKALEGEAPATTWRGSRLAVPAVLSRPIPSVQGRTDLFPVVLSSGEYPPRATPLFGKSAMISILARADGYIVIPEHAEGLDSGARVDVHLFSRS